MTSVPSGTKQFNRLAVRLAGRRWLPVWAVVHHRGRRSGREFATPVAVIASEDTFIIGLPWGRGTDWVRNVRAAGGCRITWRGQQFACSGPEFVSKDVAVSAARGLVRRAVERMDVEGGFLQLRRARA